MLNSISSATQHPAGSQPTAQPTPASQAKQPAAAPRDSVQISAAAKAVQEALESPAQTAKEASAGDLQAKHLLAEEAAAKTRG